MAHTTTFNRPHVLDERFMSKRSRDGRGPKTHPRENLIVVEKRKIDVWDVIEFLLYPVLAFVVVALGVWVEGLRPKTGDKRYAPATVHKTADSTVPAAH